MPRNHHNGRRKFDTRLSFTELCRRTGINARQRIVMRRYFIMKLKEFSKGVKIQDE